MNEREAAVHYYEMLTGVFNDDESKIIRYVCFAVLLAGIIWAGFNYFRASLLADTNTPINEDLFQDTRRPSNEAAIQRVVELARAVDTVRSAGVNIASTIEGIHNMPFNLDPEVRDIPAMSAPEFSPSAPVQEAQRIPMLNVKMIMTAENGQKIAVVDAGMKRALILKRGDRLPDDGGFVSAIRQNGITVIVNKKEIKYEIPEIPKYKEIGTKGRKSN